MGRTLLQRGAVFLRSIVLQGGLVGATLTSALGDETLVTSIDLPGASMEQEITYSPNKEEYERVRDQTLERLRKGDPSARVNPANGPWMRVETTAKIGIAYKGFGTSSGRKNLRQVSAAEEALYRFEGQAK